MTLDDLAKELQACVARVDGRNEAVERERCEDLLRKGRLDGRKMYRMEAKVHVVLDLEDARDLAVRLRTSFDPFPFSEVG